jgi:hypothetical protein
VGGSIAPFPKHQFFTNNGVVAASYKLFTYLAGTATKQATYTDYALGSANTNPIVLDSAGRATIFLSPGVAYKFVFTTNGDSDPPVSPIWTVDNVNATQATTLDVDISGVAGTSGIALGNCVYLSDGSGGTTAGRWYAADSDLTYGSVTANALGFALSAPASAGDSFNIRTSGRVTGLSGLAAGSLYYISATAGAITTTPPTNARPVGVADSATSLVVTQFVPTTDASATFAGRITTGTQTIAGAKTFTGTTTISGAIVSSSATATTFVAPPLFQPGGVVAASAARVSGRVAVTDGYTEVGTVGAGTDDLRSTTLTGGSLANDQMAIRVTAWGRFAANANNKTLNFVFGGSTLALLGASAQNNTRWYVEAIVARTGATSQEIHGIMHVTTGGAGVAPSLLSATGAETLANDVTVKFTGSGTSDNDVIQEGMVMELVG